MPSIGSRLIVGCSAWSPRQEEAQRLQAYLKEGLIGGVILFAYNILSPQQVAELIQSFYDASPLTKPFIALDQEGGRVQRLNSSNGFQDFPSARQVSALLTPQQAYELYGKMALEIKSVGFNFNLAPVVDLEYEIPSGEPCPVIGQLGRSYGPQVSQVNTYSQAFIQAHRDLGILTSLKHYPGHGFATHDSHKGMVDITHSFRSIEEEPFQNLIAEGWADSVMIGHLMNRSLDVQYPASLSFSALEKLHTYYKGATISDDFHMGAILQHFTLEEILRHALGAGVDLLVFSNNPKATGGTKYSAFEPDLVEKLHALAEKLEKKYPKLEKHLQASSLRVRKLREKLG